MTRRKHVVGLTGNIATGKTAVVRMLDELGAETMDGDAMVHQLMGPDSVLGAAIRNRFGDQVIASDGSIIRPELGKIVFSDPDALADLEAIVHPPVVEAKRARIYESGPDVLVLDAIKLFEAGLAAECDEIWVVDCDRETQIQRLTARNNIDRAEAERRIDVQAPQAEKVARADVVINNNGLLEDTCAQVVAAWERLTGQPASSSLDQPGGGTQKDVLKA